MIFILLIILVCSIVLFLVYASSSIQAGIYVKSICSFAPSQGNSAKVEEENEKCLFLSFDDGPDPVQTPKILSVLEKYNIKALFFLIGEKIDKHEDTALSIIRAGHLAGSHSYSHNPYYPIWGYRKIKADLELGQKRIAELLHKSGNAQGTAIASNLFRPPFGVTNPPIARAIKSLGLQSIGWSIRSFDTKYDLSNRRERQKVISRICASLKPGAIILLHDRLECSHILLEELICAIEKEGYKINCKPSAELKLA